MLAAPARIPPRLHQADVVFTFAWVTWQAAQGRGMNFSEDRLLLRLLDMPNVRRLLVCDTARSLPLKLARDTLQRRGAVPFPAGEGRRLHQPVRWRRDDPVSAAAVGRWVGHYERSLRRAAARMGMERPAVITFHPLVAGFGDFGWAGAVTYYGMDDWTAHPSKRAWWPVLDAAHAGMAARGRRVCVVSQRLAERIGAEEAIVVPNGLEPAEWTAPAPAPAWMRRAAAPRLVYTGSLDGRLDATWLRRLAADLPHASIHLVGRVLDAGHVEPLAELSNVTIHANVGRAEIAAIVAGADVGLLPHVDTPLTRAMSPLKVYEYLAAGLPVAATDLEPVQAIEARVVLVPAGGDFTAAVQRAATLGRAPEGARRRFIDEHAWARRHDEILDFALAPA